MKVKELIKQLKDYENFNIEAVYFRKDDSNWGANLHRFEIKVGDIGYSDKKIHLDLKEI
jgi:hypothetical protein